MHVVLEVRYLSPLNFVPGLQPLILNQQLCIETRMIKKKNEEDEEDEEEEEEEDSIVYQDLKKNLPPNPYN